jgi:hypothetical protein
MIGSHCSIIAHALLTGKQIDEKWLWDRHIRNQHKRLPIIAPEIRMGLTATQQIRGLDMMRYPITPFWPIQNIGSVDGTPFKLKSGRVTRCGVYVLPARFRPALKKAILRMGW